MATLNAKAIAYINEYDGNAIRALEAALDKMETLYERVDYGEYGEIENELSLESVIEDEQKDDEDEEDSD